MHQTPVRIPGDFDASLSYPTPQSAPRPRPEPTTYPSSPQQSTGDSDDDSSFEETESSEEEEDDADQDQTIQPIDHSIPPAEEQQELQPPEDSNNPDLPELESKFSDSEFEISDDSKKSDLNKLSRYSDEGRDKTPFGFWQFKVNLKNYLTVKNIELT